MLTYNVGRLSSGQYIAMLKCTDRHSDYCSKGLIVKISGPKPSIFDDEKVRKEMSRKAWDAEKHVCPYCQELEV